MLEASQTVHQLRALLGSLVYDCDDDGGDEYTQVYQRR